MSWDLRLAPAALGCWAAALATLHTGLRSGLILTAIAILLAALAATFPSTFRVFARPRRAGRRVMAAPLFAATEAGWVVRAWPESVRGSGEQWRWVAATAFAGLACGAGVTSAHLAVRDSAEIATLARERATAVVKLVVRDDPRPVARGSWLVEAELRQVTGQFTTRSSVLVIASHESWRQLLPGQEVTATVRFGPSRGGDLHAAVLSASSAPSLAAMAPWPQRIAGGLRAGLQKAAEPLPDKPGGLLPGLVVGDTSRLDPELEQQFRDTGMTHLCAVSGSNVAIVVGCVVLLARWSRLRPQWTAIAATIALAGFVILVRPSPSVVRAAAMGAVGLLALASGRPRAALPALGTAIMALILIDPSLAGDAGFALSVCATAGLLFLARPMRDALRRKGIPSGLAEALAVPASAQIACAPVIAALNGSVSLIAVPANLLAVPAVAPATVIGVAATLVAPVWPDAATFGAWLASWPARWLVWIAETGSATPAAEVPWPAGVAGGVLLAVVTVLCLRFKRLRIGAAAIVLGIIPVQLIAPGWPPANWIVVACDVGQGDATVLNAGSGAAVVIDAGPEPKAIDACLSRLRVTSVPLLVLSHFHVDHIGGLAALRPRELLVPAFAEPAAGREQVRKSGLPQREMTVSSVWTVGEVTLRVLYTDPLTGTRSDPNNNSVVVLATVRGVRVLLTGDAETEQQTHLFLRYPEISADILKVAHHGSSYQDTRLLELVRPRVALVSVGKGNEYGHPSLSVLAALQRGGALVARTDLDGDIAVSLADGRLLVARRGTTG